MTRLVEPAPQGSRLFSRGRSGSDNPLTRVAKYVPAETITAYVALQNILTLESQCIPGQNAISGPWWWYLIYCVLLFGTPAYLWKQRVPGQPYALHLFVGTIAFIVWSYALTSCPKFSIFHSIFDPHLASALLIIFSFVSGFIQPREKRKDVDKDKDDDKDKDNGKDTKSASK